MSHRLMDTMVEVGIACCNAYDERERDRTLMAVPRPPLDESY